MIINLIQYTIFAVVFFVMYVVGVHDGKVSSESVGNLRVDRSVPDEPPMLFLELNISPQELMSKKKVYLNVELKDFLPRN